MIHRSDQPIPKRDTDNLLIRPRRLGNTGFRLEDFVGAESAVCLAADPTGHSKHSRFACRSVPFRFPTVWIGKSDRPQRNDTLSVDRCVQGLADELAGQFGYERAIYQHLTGKQQFDGYR